VLRLCYLTRKKVKGCLKIALQITVSSQRWVFVVHTICCCLKKAVDSSNSTYIRCWALMATNIASWGPQRSGICLKLYCRDKLESWRPFDDRKNYLPLPQAVKRITFQQYFTAGIFIALHQPPPLSERSESATAQPEKNCTVRDRTRVIGFVAS